MKTRHPGLLILGWLLAGAAVFGGLTSLDLNWNMFNWRPSADATSIGALIIAAIGVGASWVLAQTKGEKSDKLVRGVSVVVCALLAAVAVASLRSEPLGTGLLGRTIASPIGYRALRAVALALPLVFWAIAFMANRKAATTTAAS